MKIARLIALSAVLAVPALSRADQSWGRLAQVRSSTMPASAAFEFFPAAGAPALAGACANHWLSFEGNTDATKATFALLLAAHLSNKIVFVEYSPTTCTVSYVTITNWAG